MQTFSSQQSQSPQLGRPPGQLRNRASTALSIMRTALSAPLLRIKKDKSSNNLPVNKNNNPHMLSVNHQHGDGSKSSPDLSNPSLNGITPVSATFFDNASPHEVSVEDFLSCDNFNHYSNLKIITTTEPLKDNSGFHGNNNFGNNMFLQQQQPQAFFFNGTGSPSPSSGSSATPTYSLMQNHHRRNDSAASAFTDEHDITPKNSPRLQPMSNHLYFNDNGNLGTPIDFMAGFSSSGKSGVQSGGAVEGDCVTPRDSMAFSFNLDNVAYNLDSMVVNEEQMELDDELMRLVMLNKPKASKGRLSVSSAASDDTAGENDDEDGARGGAAGGETHMGGGIDEDEQSSPRRFKHHRLDDDLVSEADSNISSSVPVVADSSSSREWRCFVPTCGKIYTTGAGLRYHIKHHHHMKNVPIRAARKARKEKQTQWPCSHCGKMYTSYAGLKYHQTNHHHSAVSNNQFGSMAPHHQMTQKAHFNAAPTGFSPSHQHQSSFQLMSGMEVIPENSLLFDGIMSSLFI